MKNKVKLFKSLTKFFATKKIIMLWVSICNIQHFHLSALDANNKLYQCLQLNLDAIKSTHYFSSLPA